MSLGRVGITCQHFNRCTDQDTEKCYSCKNNTHPAKKGKGSFYEEDIEFDFDDVRG